MYRLLTTIAVLAAAGWPQLESEHALRGPASADSGTALEVSVSPRASWPEDIDEELLRGTVIPAREVMVRSPEVGILAQLLAREGQSVPEGADLGRIDDRVAHASIAAAKAAAQRRGALAMAESDVAAARARVERYEKTAKSGAAPRAELEDARFGLSKAEAMLRNAREEQRKLERQYELEMVRLERHRIRAPFAGRITRILAQPGSMMTNDTDLLRLVDLSELHAELHLPWSLYPHLAVGQTHCLRGEAPVNRELKGKIIAIDPVLEPSTRTFRVVVAIPNPQGDLPAGFVAKLLLARD
jgi:RND family efflux transporter MFP subunit